MKTQNISFKGVYRVDSGNEKFPFRNIPNNEGTRKLYNLLNIGKQDDILLIQHGKLRGLIYASSPELVLTDDEISKDATPYLKLKQEFDSKISSLSDKTSKELKKMLTKHEIKIAKGEANFQRHQKAIWNCDYDKEALINQVKISLKSKIEPKENALYESFFKKATVLTSEDLKNLGKTMLKEIGNIAKKKL